MGEKRSSLVDDEMEVRSVDVEGGAESERMVERLLVFLLETLSRGSGPGESADVFALL